MKTSLGSLGPFIDSQAYLRKVAPRSKPETKPGKETKPSLLISHLAAIAQAAVATGVDYGFYDMFKEGGNLLGESLGGRIGESYAGDSGKIMGEKVGKFLCGSSAMLVAGLLRPLLITAIKRLAIKTRRYAGPNAANDPPVDPKKLESYKAFAVLGTAPVFNGVKQWLSLMTPFSDSPLLKIAEKGALGAAAMGLQGAVAQGASNFYARTAAPVQKASLPEFSADTISIPIRANLASVGIKIASDASMLSLSEVPTVVSVFNSAVDSMAQSASKFIMKRLLSKPKELMRNDDIDEKYLKTLIARPPINSRKRPAPAAKMRELTSIEMPDEHVAIEMNGATAAKSLR